jgi:hypothetical protein
MRRSALPQRAIPLDVKRQGANDMALGVLVVDQREQKMFERGRIRGGARPRGGLFDHLVGSCNQRRRHRMNPSMRADWRLMTARSYSTANRHSHSEVLCAFWKPAQAALLKYLTHYLGNEP